MDPRTPAAHDRPHFGAGVVDIDDQHRDLLCPYTRQYADQMRWVAQQASFRDGLPAEIQMQQELAEAMAPFDGLICPTTAIPACEDMLDGCVIDGENLGPPVDLPMTLPFNVNNRCPVLAMPSGHAECGVPTGIQIFGHPYDDPTVFHVGKALETARPLTPATIPARESTQ